MPQDTVSQELLRPLVVSAPGKVILFGEHSVVYGKRSLAFSLSLRSELKLCPAKDVVELHLPEIKVEKSWPISSLRSLWEKLKKCNNPSKPTLPMAIPDETWTILCSFLDIHDDKPNLKKNELGLIAFLYLYTSILSKPVPVSITVKSEMPVGAGLGSSASYGVCLAGALLYTSNQLVFCKQTVPESMSHRPDEKSLATICEWALCCEKVLHGSPSGIDNTICTYGGCVSFKASRFDLLEPPPLTIMLVNTRIPRSTKQLIGVVQEKYKRLSSVIESLFTSMDFVAESALTTISEMKPIGISKQALDSKFSLLQELIDVNQCLLRALGVSHPSLDELVATAKSHGLHGKLTGAGGGGFGIILLPPNVCQKNIDLCRKDLEAKGFEAWVTGLGGHGINFTFSK